MTVLADKILTGHGHHEFIPRFARLLPNSLQVAVGETVTLPGSSLYTAIEVAGTLRCSRTEPTNLRVVHLTILPGGTFDCGTVSDPVLQRVRIEIADVAIDTTRDPYQFGNGIINLGRWMMAGVIRTPKAILSADALAAVTVVSVPVPTDWQIGDEVFLPDMRQLNGTEHPQREPRIFITSKAPDSITLSQPLVYDHRSVTAPDGTVKVRPRIANLSRGITVLSENAHGARGHTINLGHDASWDLRGVQFIGLGRTTADSLDNTTADASGAIVHVGTNQVGRYTRHDHHTQGFGSGMWNCVLTDGADGRTKWGYAVHGTHDVVNEDNIALDFQGAGFVTEDGYEVRNVFRRNIAIGSLGNGLDAIGQFNPPRSSPGGEGAGFWFRGPHNIFDDNEAWNNSLGYQIFQRELLTGQVPSVPGGHADTLFDPREALPISFSGNVALSNRRVGLETWNTPVGMNITNLLVAHNGGANVLVGGGQGGNIRIEALRSYGRDGVADGVNTTAAYHSEVEILGGEILGARVGLYHGKLKAIFRDLVLQNVININLRDYVPPITVMDTLTHVPFGTHSPKYVVLPPAAWSGTGPLPVPQDAGWHYQNGARIRVTNWQGTGQDYLLYTVGQKASLPAWPSSYAHGEHQYCPVVGITMGECWSRFGLAYFSGVIPDAEAQTLAGVNGLAWARSAPTLGPPRVVLTLPNAFTEAAFHPGSSQVLLRFLLTGDPKLASDVAVIQIDGEAPVRRRPVPWGRPDFVDHPTSHIAPGTHRVVTWRENASGAKVSESELTFTFVIGQPSESQSASIHR